MLANLELRGKRPEEARRQLELADADLDDDSPASFGVNSQRLRAASFTDEDRHDEAEALYREIFEAPPADSQGSEEAETVQVLQCFARADYVLSRARRSLTDGLERDLEELESFARQHPSAQDGHLLLHTADALVSCHARRGNEPGASRALDLIRTFCTTKETAFEAASLLQRLTGRLGHLKVTSIALACAQLSAELARIADRDDFFWAAQANLVSVYLSSGQLDEARRQLKLLDPVLRNDQADPQLKAGILSLAAMVLAESGAHEQAIGIVEKAQGQMRADPAQIGPAELERGRYLRRAGRAEEALGAFINAERLAREIKARGEIRFHINVLVAEAATELGRWEEAEAALIALRDLPRGPEFANDVLDALEQQLRGTRVIKNRVEDIRALTVETPAASVIAANAQALKPLLAWWRDFIDHSKPSGLGRVGLTDNELGALGVLYDYWGGGSASKIMANLRHHAPNHFAPFVEVRSVQEARRAIRMLALVSDCLVLLWKGPMETAMAVSVGPFDHICGGAGYIATLGSLAWESKETGPWFPIIGYGPFLPVELIKLLAKDALPLIEQGRLIVLPAPAVGCWQDPFGPAEHLLANLMAATPMAHSEPMMSSFPLGVLPFFEDAPLGLLADLLAKDTEAPRRLRLALIRKTNELRMHGAAEAVSREIADEIADALASMDDTHRGISRKRGYATRHDSLGATAITFRDAWAPILTLRRLGYRMTLAQTRDGKKDSPVRFGVEKGTPFGNWLMPPGQHVGVPTARVVK
jgi:tetratricopeptide (TPR) repeat protein